MKDLRINTGSINLQVREYEREGEAIIFLHFGGGNLMMWQRTVPYFQDHHRLILIDLRDHGKSDKPQTNGHIDTMARDVIGVMKHLELERAHIIGSSLGAEVGLSIAANYPEKVISLVCEGALSSEYGPYSVWDGTEAEFKEHAAKFLADLRNKPDKVFSSVEALVESRKQVFQDEWNEYFEALQKYDAFEVGAGKFTRSWQNKAMEKYFEHYFEYRFEGYYKRVKCPVLMLPGEEDAKDERAKLVMTGLSKLVDKAKIVAVPGWSHPYGWLMEDPAPISKVILEFLHDVRN